MPGYISDLEEFAFFNQQLSNMLKAGIPLEGGLEKLCGDMKKGRLKSVFEPIQERLSQGERFSNILTDLKNKLPPLYYRLCVIGEKSENLPHILTKLAAYYRWQGGLKGRLKTLMFYPMILMVASILVSAFLAYMIPGFFQEVIAEFYDQGSVPGHMLLLKRLPYYYLGGITSIFFLYILAVYTPVLNFITDYLSWRLKVTRYLQLANLSSMFEALLASGVPFSDSISLMEGLSENRKTKSTLRRIDEKTAKGVGVAEAFEAEEIFPSVYTWVLKNSGEQLPEGFRQNAVTYGTRAKRYMDICLYGAMPLAMVFIGALVLGNLAVFFQMLHSMMGPL